MRFELQWIPATDSEQAKIDIYGVHRNGKYLIETLPQGQMNADLFWDHYKDALTGFSQMQINTYEPSGLNQPLISIVDKTGILTPGIADTPENLEQLKAEALSLIKHSIYRKTYGPNTGPRLTAA
ncbi:MAG: hypothetical protein CMH30_01670 [Micavibrio sp.]|nr:hypothetical protein [Micavibrio sp.]|tara:strand:+ start:370 stop:744 length:375 start_codon:yes stop_codon:yes gene_type:complete